MLHELVARHAQTMFAELRDADPDGGGLPRYVERELAAYLRCEVIVNRQTGNLRSERPVLLIGGIDDVVHAFAIQVIPDRLKDDFFVLLR